MLVQSNIDMDPHHLARIFRPLHWCGGFQSTLQGPRNQLRVTEMDPGFFALILRATPPSCVCRGICFLSSSLKYTGRMPNGRSVEEATSGAAKPGIHTGTIGEESKVGGSVDRTRVGPPPLTAGSDLPFWSSWCLPQPELENGIKQTALAEGKGR